MDTFLFLLIVLGVIIGGILAWTYTKRGKKWLTSL